MKKILSILPLMFVFGLTGCGGVTYTEVNVFEMGSVRNTTNHSITYSCFEFDGRVDYKFNIKEDQSYEVTTNATCEGGSIQFIFDGNEELTFKLSQGEELNEVVDLKEFGQHKLRIIGEHFEGSYSIDWAKTE